jgi:kinetochore protein Mis13/DSN1
MGLRTAHRLEERSQVRTVFLNSERNRLTLGVVYEEDDDGFAFSRAKSKKVKEAPAEPAPEPPKSKRKKPSITPAPTSDDSSAPKRRRSARLSGDRDEVAAEIQPAKVQKPSRSKKAVSPRPAEAEHDDSPQRVGGELRVEKKREPTRITLPFADTPIIKRNKEMRAEKSKASSNSRRSSTAMRGRRASSLIESGTSNGRTSTISSTPMYKSARNVRVYSSNNGKSASGSCVSSAKGYQSYIAFSMYLKEDELKKANIFGLKLEADPHLDVEIRDFYKLIENGLPEPKRMRQLLTWCGSRALPEKVQGTGDMTEDLAVDAGMYHHDRFLMVALTDTARHIDEELLKDFANKMEMSDWFSRVSGIHILSQIALTRQQEDESAASTLIKRPNPRNIQNETKIRELEQEIQRYNFLHASCTWCRPLTFACSLNEEESAWKTLLKPPKPEEPAHQSQQPRPEERRPRLQSQKLDPSFAIDTTLLDPKQLSLLGYLDPPLTASTTATQSSLATKVSARIETLTSNLEPSIDAFADGVHRLSQYNMSAARIADRVKNIWAQRLEKRDVEARSHGGNGEVGGRDILRALSVKMNEK